MNQLIDRFLSVLSVLVLVLVLSACETSGMPALGNLGEVGAPSLEAGPGEDEPLAGAVGATEDESTPAEEGTLVPASVLLGTTVRSSDGEELGVLEELIVETQTGAISYAIIESGGVLDVGDRNLIVPFATFALVDPFGVTSTLSASDLESAPTVPSEEWPLYGDEAWADEVNAYWGEMSVDAEELAAARTGANFGLRISQMIGYGITNSAFANGSVYDVLVDVPRGQATWVLLDAALTDDVGIGDTELLVIPFEAFRPDVFADELVFRVGVAPEILEAAPHVDVEMAEMELIDPTVDDTLVDYWEDWGSELD